MPTIPDPQAFVGLEPLVVLMIIVGVIVIGVLSVIAVMIMSSRSDNKRFRDIFLTVLNNAQADRSQSNQTYLKLNDTIHVNTNTISGITSSQREWVDNFMDGLDKLIDSNTAGFSRVVDEFRNQFDSFKMNASTHNESLTSVLRDNEQNTRNQISAIMEFVAENRETYNSRFDTQMKIINESKLSNVERHEALMKEIKDALSIMRVIEKASARLEKETANLIKLVEALSSEKETSS